MDDIEPGLLRPGPVDIPLWARVLVCDAAVPALGAAFAVRVGRSITEATTVGRTNMPNPGSQSKYRSPCTEPSFFPESSFNSTPIHSPSAKLVAPMYRTVACRPSVSVTTQPVDSSAMLIVLSRSSCASNGGERKAPSAVRRGRRWA